MLSCLGTCQDSRNGNKKYVELQESDVSTNEVAAEMMIPQNSH